MPDRIPKQVGLILTLMAELRLSVGGSDFGQWVSVLGPVQVNIFSFSLPLFIFFITQVIYVCCRKIGTIDKQKEGKSS